MTTWLRELRDIVNNAARAADLPHCKGADFDGEGWVWDWLFTGDPIRSVWLYAAPTVDGRGLDVRVVATASSPNHPEDSWSRTYTSYVHLSETGQIRDAAFAEQLGALLKRAYSDASDEGKDSVNIMQSQRTQLIKKLESQGLLHR